MKTKCRFLYQIVLVSAFFIMFLSGMKLHSEAAALKINKKSLVLLEEEKFQLKISGIAKSQVTWTSTDQTVAKVSAKGKVTALKRGTTTILARTRSGKKFSCSLRVAERPLVAANLIEMGDDPEVMIGMTVGIIGSRKARIINKITLSTPGKGTKDLFLLDVDKSIQKEKLVWKKSFYLKPSTLQEMNVATCFYAGKDQAVLYVGNKTKAVLYFVYDGTKMKVTVPNRDLSGKNEIRYCKVSRAE